MSRLEQEGHCSGHMVTKDATRKKLTTNDERMPALKVLHAASAHTLSGTA